MQTHLQNVNIIKAMNEAMHMHLKMVYYVLNLLIIKTAKQNIQYILYNMK